MSDDRLLAAAEKLAAQLRATGRRLVLAESCTGGLAAATLTRFPGISEYLCGSAVVYRNSTKTDWLGVPAVQLNDSEIGPVSPQTADDMARGALTRTGEADVAASITGHLGPDAPEGLDGVVFIGIAQRGLADSIVQRHILEVKGRTVEETRAERQRAATCLLFDLVRDYLTSRSV